MAKKNIEELEINKEEEVVKQEEVVKTLSETSVENGFVTVILRQDLNNTLYASKIYSGKAKQKIVVPERLATLLRNKNIAS